ncbi:MAG: phosphoglycerate kinase [Sphingomonadales bacterium]
MGNLKKIDGLGKLKGKRVLVRVDLNVPMSDGKVTDLTRISAIKTTIDDLLKRGAKVILISHFGRPGGKFDPSLSLKHLIPTLEKTLGHVVTFAGDVLGNTAGKTINKGTGVFLLENLRFHPGEEENQSAFARQLADLGDAFVNDAFSCAHRAHASTVGIVKFLPSAVGHAMEKEIEALEAVLENAKHPVCAVVGGSKVSTKIALLENLIDKVDHIIIGGGMANTFLAAQGRPVGASMCEHDLKDTALKILALAKEKGVKIHLPGEVTVAKKMAKWQQAFGLSTDKVEKDDLILDVGPRTSDAYQRVGRACKTLLWNGPLGVFEIKPFDKGTIALAKWAAKQTKSGRLVSVAGGGDTVAALNHAGVKDKFSYVSTAGGAFLEWLEGKSLPGVEALAA